MSGSYPWLSVLDPHERQLSDEQIRHQREIYEKRTRRAAFAVACLLVVSTVGAIVINAAG